MAYKRRYEGKRSGRTQSRVQDQINDMAMLLAGVAIGSMAMYIFDANSGERRRALARDKMVHYLKLMQRSARRHAEDWKNRALGSVAEMRSRMQDAQYFIDDAVLESRVRAQVGHAVRHPGKLEVRADGGRVVVRGEVLRGEREKMLDRLHKTRGVRQIELHVTERALDQNPEVREGTREVAG
jgi:hypothetical protein